MREIKKEFGDVFLVAEKRCRNGDEMKDKEIKEVVVAQALTLLFGNGGDKYVYF